MGVLNCMKGSSVVILRVRKGRRIRIEFTSVLKSLNGNTIFFCCLKMVGDSAWKLLERNGFRIYGIVCSLCHEEGEALNEALAD